MLNKIKVIISAAVLSLAVSANVQAATITVKKGDTLWDLSRDNHTSVENIQKINHLTSDLIHPGDELAVAKEKHYTVKKEDTLIDIAKEQHVTVSQIKEWNDLLTNMIHPGLDLVIYQEIDTTKKDKKEKVTKPAKQKVKAASIDKKEVKARTDKKIINVKATAYTAYCEGCSGTTATGIDLRANPNKKVIAVDPSVIPLGSKVYVEGFGEAIAGDTGGAIKGNRIDVFIPSEDDANEFGVQHLKVTILD
ncbi:3D domain-containing protein [Neobacillus kokaensis]|uniref:Cell wall-binding protein YocH n=1 Tax=Neobacillus kokaensis TaxID=2759023 RepID=A0ABQ3N0F4_9BACI|nr:3D domain-containing protein [Neobacillus kokaensis]GHH98049.1 cell wall-binding protein YocH [Neobacillus kokaensis]